MWFKIFHTSLDAFHTTSGTFHTSWNHSTRCRQKKSRQPTTNMQREEGDSGGGGRRQYSMLGIPWDRWIIIMTFILLCILGLRFTSNDIQNIQILTTLSTSENGLSDYHLNMETELAPAYNFLTENIDLLPRRMGRHPRTQLSFNEFFPIIRNYLLQHVNIPSFEDLVESFWRMTRFISDNEGFFTADTSKSRIVYNFNVFITTYPVQIDLHRFLNVLHPDGPETAGGAAGGNYDGAGGNYDGAGVGAGVGGNGARARAGAVSNGARAGAVGNGARAGAVGNGSGAEPSHVDRMQIYRLPSGVSTLETGFAYINRSHIPFTGAAANITGMETDEPRRDEPWTITAQPGFASAFNRALNHISLRDQLSDFFTHHPNGANANLVQSDRYGFGVDNTGPDAIPVATVCSFYAGFLTRCITDRARCNRHDVASDRKINVSITFTSKGNARLPPPYSTTTAMGGTEPLRIPRTTTHTERLTLIGWTGEMLRLVPPRIRPMAGMAAHSCDPNCFLHDAPRPEPENDSDTTTTTRSVYRPFTLSGTFEFQHQVKANNGMAVCYDELMFKLTPCFLHSNLNTTIQVGGRCCIDYGPAMVEKSDFHILRNSQLNNLDARKTLKALRDNDETRVRLHCTNDPPISCQSECCDEAVQSGEYARSHLYFDGQVTDIDYDRIREMLLGPQAQASVSPPPADGVIGASNNNNRHKRRMQEDPIAEPHHNYCTRAKKRAREEQQPTSVLMSGHWDSVQDFPNHDPLPEPMTVIMTSNSNSDALNALCDYGDDHNASEDDDAISVDTNGMDCNTSLHADVAISDMQEMPPSLSPLAQVEDMLALSPTANDVQRWRYASPLTPDDQQHVSPLTPDVQRHRYASPLAADHQRHASPIAAEQPSHGENDITQATADNGVLSLVITWAYAIFNMLVTAYYTSNMVWSFLSWHFFAYPIIFIIFADSRRQKVNCHRHHLIYFQRSVSCVLEL